MKGWYSRGYLPHFDGYSTVQFITTRLYDSIAAEYQEYVSNLRKVEDNPKALENLEMLLDKGLGNCYLRNPSVAECIQNNLLYFDNRRYKLINWVIMPNHVHILLELHHNISLENMMHSFKSYTANQSNKILGLSGSSWLREYFDRYIRDEYHFYRTIEYIHQNPVKAGLVKNAKDWIYSSAYSFHGIAGCQPAIKS